MYDYKDAIAGFLNLTDKSEIGDIYWEDTTAIFNVEKDKCYLIDLVDKELRPFVIKKWQRRRSCLGLLLNKDKKQTLSYLRLEPSTEKKQTLEELENGFHVGI